MVSACERALVGGKLLGFVGVVAAVPIAATFAVPHASWLCAAETKNGAP